jgi:CRISPR-associated protein Csx17
MVALDSSLFATSITSRFKGAMGQYHPAATERSNAWDFVLLIEGALVFAAAATRRYESASPMRMAFPFHARAAGGSTNVTDTDEDGSRDELWLPLWSSPARLRTIRRLFAEGRATVGSGDAARPGVSALDFARAIAALGVDRGIESFTRVGFHVRNGLAYFATPLGRFPTREVPSVRLLDELDGWFGRFRSRASGRKVPERVAVARRRLETAMFEVAAGGAVGPLVLALGDVELALARSLAFAAKEIREPVPGRRLVVRSWHAPGQVRLRAATLPSRRSAAPRASDRDATDRGAIRDTLGGPAPPRGGSCRL